MANDAIVKLGNLVEDVRSAGRRSDPHVVDQSRSKLSKEIRNCLEECRKNPNEAGRDFVCKEDLEQILTYHCLEAFFYDLLDRQQLSIIAKGYIQVVSILIWIYWDDWSNFAVEFLCRRDLSDATLPFEPIPRVITEAGRRFESSFRSDQYIFTPVILCANDDLEYPNQWRLPLFGSVPLGEGAYGVVTERKLAAKHMIWRNEIVRTNEKDFPIACKIIPAKHAVVPRGEGQAPFVQEQKSLSHYRKSLNTSKNVMSSIASFRHGEDFIILSYVADLNLEKFITGKYPDYLARRKLFTPSSILKEASHLAGALSFIHDRLRHPDKIVSIAHLDVKPDNILICWNESGDNDGVGRWKLHDFGISRVKSTYLTENSGHTSTFRNTSIKEPRTYTAPEISYQELSKIGPASDMWSFGCILAVLVTFILEGPEKVRLFGKQRVKDDHGQEMKLDHFHTGKDGKVDLKNSVKHFLHDLTQVKSDANEAVGRSGNDRKPFWKILPSTNWNSGQRNSGSWQADIGRLLKAMLDVRVENRQQLERKNKFMMEAVQETLDDLVRDHDFTLKQRRLWMLDPTSSTNLEVTTHLPLTPRSSRGPDDYNNGGGITFRQVTYPISPTDTATTAELASPVSDSRSASSSSQPVVHTPNSVFAAVSSPSHAFKAALCPHGANCATISTKEAFIHNVDSVPGWTLAKIPKSKNGAAQEAVLSCPSGYVWDKIALADRFLVLRAAPIPSRRGELRCVLHYLERIPASNDRWQEGNQYVTQEFSTAAGVNVVQTAVRICVSARGSMLFELDQHVICYYNNFRLRKLPPFSPPCRIQTLSFNSVGDRIYCWTDKSFHIWNADPFRVLYTTPYTAPKEINPLFDRTNLMIPCSDGFLAISTPGHICVVGCFDTKILYNFQQSSIVQPDIIAGASFTLPGNNPDTIVALIKHERSPSKNVLYTCRISADRTISALVERTKLPRPFTGEQDSIAMVLHNNQLCATINYTEGLLHRIYLSE